ncbi:tripartite tricarboxylate transporter permease [Brevundimonas diminuta]|uniref:tripartite tricarboxylate transporter permease n=1 Tax=Brevundimonas diminuta TaxID=293 RepID=UPI003D018872
MTPLLHDILVAAGMGLIGAVLFSAIGLISGTDETTTIAPITLLVVLLGVPPVGVFTFWLASAVAKHMTHAIPTALLGIPGDTMAVPMMDQATTLRRLGAPHIALRKMVAAGLVSAAIAVPLSVGFALLLAPIGQSVEQAAPWLFLAAAVLISYFSAGRFASVLLLAPFVMLVVALRALTNDAGLHLSVTFFLGIAIGPLIADLFSVMAPKQRDLMRRDGPRHLSIAADLKEWSGRFPNPFKVLEPLQVRWVAMMSAISSATFVFSPVAMSVMLGEAVATRIRHPYQRLTTVLSVRNGVSESTYIAEAIIPLIAFGLPLSPVAAGPAAPLFNAPPRFFVDGVGGEIVNLHTLMSPLQFLGYGMLAVALAGLIAYPLAMNFARAAAVFVSRRISHEAIIATFVGLVLVIGLWEGGLLGLLVILTMGLVGGLLNRIFGFNSGVQFMGYYVAVLSVPALVALAA